MRIIIPEICILILLSSCAIFTPVTIDMNQDSAQNVKLREYILKENLNAIYIGSICNDEKPEINQMISILEAAQNPYGSYVPLWILTNPNTKLRYYIFYNFTSLGMVEGSAYVAVWDPLCSRVIKIAKIFWIDGIDDKVFRISQHKES